MYFFKSQWFFKKSHNEFFTGNIRRNKNANVDKKTVTKFACTRLFSYLCADYQ